MMPRLLAALTECPSGQRIAEGRADDAADAVEAHITGFCLGADLV